MGIPFIPILAVVFLLGVAAVFIMVRAMPRAVPRSADERKEMSNAPMPGLQKRAWWTLLLGVASLGTITAILLTQGGAAAYWDDDNLRMLVLLIFFGGLFGYVAVFVLPTAVKESSGGLDERDKLILSRATRVQPPAGLITLGAWLASLPRMFHDEGAVPVVYLYLMFGSVILAYAVAHAGGVLLGYWIAARHGES